MKTGFWTRPDVNVALETTRLPSGDDATIFLHGVCGAFALALHERFGFDVAFVIDEYAEEHTLDELVHVYCLDDGDFVDVRGRVDDEDAFLEDFEDFLAEPVHVGVDAKTLEETLTRWMGRDALERYKTLATGFIREHEDFYAKGDDR